MKNKKWISLATAVVLAVTALPLGVFAAKKDEAKLAKVTLNEVAHSIFYAPQYVAIEEGYFKDEGLDMTLITGFGADKTMTAVISGEADIGFMGAEASIYAYQEGATDPVVNFAQLTQRAGNFLVAREEMPDFKWEDLKGRKVLGGRKGGMPEMVFEYILKQNGLDPQKDLSIDQSIDFGATAAAFTGDDSADFTVEFEPSATALEKQGAGYVVASLGVDSGYVPYTSYSAKTSYMEKNPDISDNSLCTGHASGRIGNSAGHSLCYRGCSQDQFFQAYHNQGAEQNTEDHRSQKRAENHLEEQQFQDRRCKQSRQASGKG